MRNPFSLASAAKFAAFFALVLLLVKLVQSYFPSQGVYVVAALAGLTDVDAITLSMAEYAKANDPGTAVRVIVFAALTNAGEVRHGGELGRASACAGRSCSPPP